MSTAILSTYHYIQQVLHTKGDGILIAGEDPFMYNQHYGPYIEVWSADGSFLTWSFLEGAIVAMYKGLYLRDKYKTTSFAIWDSEIGIIVWATCAKRGLHL